MEAEINETTKLAFEEVVWVFGNSAAGKETFIKYVTESSDKQLYDRLGWTNKKVKVAPSSIDNIGQFLNDPITLMRDGILTETPQLLQEADVVLIKWQTVDSEADRIHKLMALLPDVLHRIILISTPRSELTKRLPNKSWWDDDEVDAFIQEENESLVQIISDLKDKLPVIEISGSPADDYRPVSKSQNPS